MSLVFVLDPFQGASEASFGQRGRALSNEFVRSQCTRRSAAHADDITDISVRKSLHCSVLKRIGVNMKKIYLKGTYNEYKEECSTKSADGR